MKKREVDGAACCHLFDNILLVLLGKLAHALLAQLTLGKDEVVLCTLFNRGDDNGEYGYDDDNHDEDDHDEDDHDEDDHDEDDNDENSDCTHLVSRGGRGEVQEGVRGVDQAR